MSTATVQRPSEAAPAAQTGVCATITSGCSTIASTVRSAGSMVYSGGSFVVSTMCSPIESTNHAIAYAKRQYDIYGHLKLAAVSMVAATSATSTLATLFTSTPTVTAAVIGPVTLGLSVASFFAAQEFGTYASSKKLLEDWAWTLFVPMAGVAWATATPFAAVLAITMLAAAGALGLTVAVACKSGDTASGNMTAEQIEAGFRRIVDGLRAENSASGGVPSAQFEADVARAEARLQARTRGVHPPAT